MFRKFSSNQTGAGIIYCILEIVHFEDCFANVGDRVGDHRVETYAFTIRGRRGKSRKALGARLYILMEHRIKVKRNDPVKARAQDSLELSQPNEYAFLIGHDNHERHESLERPLYNLKELIEHEPEPPRRLVGFSDYLGPPSYERVKENGRIKARPIPDPLPDPLPDESLSAAEIHKRYRTKD
jgi:hypothetical protein